MKRRPPSSEPGRARERRRPPGPGRRADRAAALALALLVPGSPLSAQEAPAPTDLPELDPVTDLDQVVGDGEAPGFDSMGEGGGRRDPLFDRQLRDAAERDGWGLASEAELAARAARALTRVSNAEARQVVVAPRQLARALLELSVQTRRHFVATLGEGPGETLPCVIRYVPLPAEPGEATTLVRLISVEGLGWRAELALRPGVGLDERALRLAVVEMLFKERIARGLGDLPPTDAVAVPHWLCTGTLVLMERLARWDDHRLAAGMLRQGRIPPLRELLASRGEDLPGTREELETASAALVLALRGEEPGKGPFDAWVQGLAQPSANPLEQLVLQFVPADLGEEELERRYRAALRSLADAGPFDRFGVAESRDALDRWMRVAAPEAGEVAENGGGGESPEGAENPQAPPPRARSVAEVLEGAEKPDEATLLRWLTVLDAARERVNPLYGSTVARQGEILRRLGQGKLDLAAARVAWAGEVEEMAAIDELLRAIGSRLDEYQINHGRADARWMARLTQAQREADLQPLLDPRGLLHRRLDRAEWTLPFGWQADAGAAQQDAAANAPTLSEPVAEDGGGE